MAKSDVNCIGQLGLRSSNTLPQPPPPSHVLCLITSLWFSYGCDMRSEGRLQSGKLVRNLRESFWPVTEGNSSRWMLFACTCVLNLFAVRQRLSSLWERNRRKYGSDVRAFVRQVCSFSPPPIPHPSNNYVLFQTECWPYMFARHCVILNSKRWNYILKYEIHWPTYLFTNNLKTKHSLAKATEAQFSVVTTWMGDISCLI